MGEVKELGRRLERWTEAHRGDDLTVKVSSHGRLMLRSGDDTLVLEFVESMHLLQGVLREYTEHGFNTSEEPETDPPPATNALRREDR